MRGRRRTTLLAASIAALLAFAGVARAGELPPRPTPRIVGGQPAANGAWPSAAFLVGFEDTNGDGALEPSFACTGSVIAPTWIVTAAHCVLDDSGATVPAVVAVLGVSDYNDQSAEVIRSAALVPHRLYNVPALRNDIALIQLSRPTRSPGMRLASASELNAGRYVSPSNVVNAAGWGTTDQYSTQTTSALQQAYLAIQSDADCEQLVPYYDAATMTCAGTPNTAGACHGDSGGPLVVFDAATSERVLWGLTSYGPQALYGDPPCALNRPAAFTWIPAFRDFIDSTINAAPPQQQAPPPPAPAPQPQPPAPPVDRTPPAIRSLTLTRSSFRAARRGSMFAAAGRTVLAYRLSEPATVKVTVQHARTRHGHVRWTSLAPSGSLRSGAGLNAVPFSGRLPGRRLSRGRYRLSLTAVDAAGNRSLARTVPFRITG